MYVHYDISNVETLRLNVLSSIAVKFRQFNSNLIATYILGARKGENHCTKYACIDEETWQLGG